MAISQGMIFKCVSIDRTHKVLFTTKYIIKVRYILNLVIALLAEQCQSRRILSCQSLSVNL